MKGRFVAFVGVFCIASLIASGVYAKGKPDKPGGPEIEWISFVGDLKGGQLVVGCCPNAGPWPAYTMTLSDAFGALQGTYLGQLFMNFKGKKPQEYKVQFWTDDIFFEIVGGEIDNDKKNKTLTVRFNQEGQVMHGSVTSPVWVTFDLTRKRP